MTDVEKKCLMVRISNSALCGSINEKEDWSYSLLTADIFSLALFTGIQLSSDSSVGL